MLHLCVLRALNRQLNYDKVKLCSSFVFNKHTNQIPNSYSITTKRNVSFRSTIESVIQTHTGFFKALSESTPVAYAQEFLVNVHTYTGLPWWATIICTTICLRTCVTIPLAIYQHYIMAKLENLQLEMRGIAEELKKETVMAMKQFQWSERDARIAFKRSIKKQWNKLIVRENCHPFKASLLLWVQLPMWVCLSVSFRNLIYMLPEATTAAHVTKMQLATEGVAWIPNLLVPDTTLLLPLTLGLVNLAIIEIQEMSRKKPATKLQRYLTHFFRGFSLLTIPISASVPSCLALYWVTSSVHGLAQNLILMSPKFKRISGIPETPTEFKKPYVHLINTFKNKFHTRKRNNVDTNS